MNHQGNYVKDLTIFKRDLKQIIIVDNSPTCYSFQPMNAIGVTSWFDDPEDKELLELIPFLDDLSLVDDVRVVLDNNLE